MRSELPATPDTEEPPTVVGRGRRGEVSVQWGVDQAGVSVRVATKTRREGAPPDCIRKEAASLAIANSVNVGPRLLGLSPDGQSVAMEFVEGLPLLGVNMCVCLMPGDPPAKHLADMIYNILLLQYDL